MNFETLISELDRSGRPPRDAQKEILKTLCDNWDKFSVFNIIAPTSSGKSLISRAIQIQTNASIITPNNVLVQQYVNEYRDMNYFIGADHFKSRHQYQNKRFAACYPYNHTVYNPISWLVAKRTPEFEHPNVVIVDEGHAINGLLLEHSTYSFNIPANIRFKNELTEYNNFLEFVRGQIATVRADLSECSDKAWLKRDRLERKEERLVTLLAALKDEPENLALYYNEKVNERGRTTYYVCVKPVRIPITTLRRFFGDAKIILMSATMFPSDIMELSAGKKYYTCEVESPIPLERRPIFYYPTTCSMRYNEIDYQEIANRLDFILDETELRPALIHASYRDATQISRYMKTKHLTHDAETKVETLNKFIQEGGVLLGSGMSEGLDLKDDLCRLNIIVKLLFPNLGDPYVQKRRALADGEWWYKLSTLKTFIQQAGRATRSPNDYSMTIILDSRIGNLLSSLKEELPSFIRGAIKWQTVNLKHQANQLKANFGGPG